MVQNVDHPHGDAGDKPPDNLNFSDGDYPNPEHFDWFWDQVPDAINDHQSLLEAIDSNEDGIVDEAEYAQNSDFVDNEEPPFEANVVNDSDQVDGYHAASFLNGSGAFNLPSHDISPGNFIAIARVPSPANLTLTIQRAVIVSGSFNTPAGLQIIIRDVSAGTNLATYEGYNEVNETYDVGGSNILIAADNGQYGGGTGSDQENVTVTLNAWFE